MKLGRAELEEKVRKALVLPLPYQDHYDRSQILRLGLQDQIIPSAVLILFGYSAQDDQKSLVLYLKRTHTVETHKGQMAFPGGRCDPEDGNQAIQTALRETWEETGIPPGKIKILGEMPSCMTLTGYLIQPVVGQLIPSIEDTPFTLSAHEVEEAVWISLETPD